MWPGMVRCESVGRGKHRKPGTGGWRHGQVLSGASMHGQDANRKIREKNDSHTSMHRWASMVGTDRHRSCLGLETHKSVYT